MSKKLSMAPTVGPRRIWRKTFVAGFVAASYLAYALHQHLAVASQDVAALPPTLEPGQGALQAQPSPTAPPAEQDTATPNPAPRISDESSPAEPSDNAAASSSAAQPSPSVPTPVPALPTATQPPAPTATAPATKGSLYKNGTFTGATANAFYGDVQVQVVISQGRISSVTFLNYPKDRRTSARINSFAVPYLQSEAIQAQSARVNIISGATLTSEAFMVSLQSALNNARG